LEFGGEYVFAVVKLQVYIFDSYTSSDCWSLMLLSVGSKIAGHANTLKIHCLRTFLTWGWSLVGDRPLQDGSVLVSAACCTPQRSDPGAGAQLETLQPRYYGVALKQMKPFEMSPCYHISAMSHIELLGLN